MTTKLTIHFVGLKGVPATYGGVEHAVQEVGARLADRGHRIVVHCRRHYTSPDLATHRGMILNRGGSIRTKRLDTISHTFLALLSAVRQHPNVIGLHNYPNGPLAVIGRFASTPVALHLHGFEWGLGKWNTLDKAILKLLLQPAAKAPTAITSVSRIQAEFFQEATGRSVIHIPNGVDPPAFVNNGGDPGDFLNALELDSKGYILCVSRLVPQKGVEHLIHAYRASRLTYPLIIVGDHNHAPEYAAKLRAAAGDDTRIRFLGYRFGDELWTLYAGCKLFVLPSESEGMPLVLLEAMAARCPILASRLPEIEDVGQSCISYFRSMDREDLRTQMETLLRDDGERGRLGDAANIRASQHYTWERVTDAYEKLYMELASGNRRRFRISLGSG